MTKKQKKKITSDKILVDDTAALVSGQATRFARKTLHGDNASRCSISPHCPGSITRVLYVFYTRAHALINITKRDVGLQYFYIYIHKAGGRARATVAEGKKNEKILSVVVFCARAPRVVRGAVRAGYSRTTTTTRLDFASCVIIIIIQSRIK